MLLEPCTLAWCFPGVPDRDAAKFRPPQEVCHRHCAIRFRHDRQTVGRTTRATTGDSCNPRLVTLVDAKGGSVHRLFVGLVDHLPIHLRMHPLSYYSFTMKWDQKCGDFVLKNRPSGNVKCFPCTRPVWYSIDDLLCSKDGAYIRGLFLEGARWDPEEQSLNGSRPKQLYTSLPVLHLDPQHHRKNPDSGVYRCPVYKVRVLRRT